MSVGRLKYLFFFTKPYLLSSLEPIDQFISSSNSGETAWFTISTAKNIIPNGKLLKTTEELITYNPDVIFTPANIVPSHWPGLKVKIFHGLGEEKKGHYRLNGLFEWSF
ncbi:MAG: hypothetical protein GWP19_07600 [Planctomycetia bacterium]|nr:hypothetical protein [Planctomycetia bacterium]